MRQKIYLLFYAALVLGFIYFPIEDARAQTFTIYDLLAAVNSLRASYGLAPYEADSSLMTYAQEHSEYQASTGVSTHTHSDGNSPRTYGVTENVAAGTIQFMTLDFVIYQIWADSIHMNTMVGYESGYAGVGIATSGGDVYITLDVRPGKSAATLPSGSTGSTGSEAPLGTSIALVPLTTATPNPNGSIVHLVGYGQSLWSIAIAYGVKIDEIRTLNGLVPGSTDIYAGQKLVIHPEGYIQAASPTAVEAGTEEPDDKPQLTPPATPKPTRSNTPQISPTQEQQAVRMINQTPTPEDAPFEFSLGKNNRRIIAALLILIGVLGVAWVVRTGF